MLSRFVALLCILAFMKPLVKAQISMNSLKGFWEASYDLDKDGVASIHEFANYFNRVEPQHNVTIDQCQPIFDFFDANNDRKVTLDELISIARIKVSYNLGHKQIHLGLTEKQGQMQVIWVSNPEHYDEPFVEYGRIPTMFKSNANATFHSYNVGKIGGFHGRIYVAVMRQLQPTKRYYYRVGDRKTRTYSKIKYFMAPPLRVQTLEQLNIAVFGDMGTFAPFGNFVIDKIAKDHLLSPFNFVFLTGDIAYAGVNSYERGENSPIWDLFGQLTEKFAAYTAFMPGVGNHESYYNYTAYQNRYILPKSYPNQTNFYFSFDYAQVHFVHFSSEHPYSAGSQQYKFLENDLKNARNNPSIQWIVVGVHRTFYSSNQEGYSPERELNKHLEDMMYKYKVDIVQTGHLHNYERTYPVHKGKAIMKGVNHTHYIDPQAPVYMTQGTAGALIKQKFVKPAPQWSVSRQDKYGYGRINIKGNKLKYQFISLPTGRISDEFTIVKTSKTNINPRATSETINYKDQ